MAWCRSTARLAATVPPVACSGSSHSAHSMQLSSQVLIIALAAMPLLQLTSAASVRKSRCISGTMIQSTDRCIASAAKLHVSRWPCQLCSLHQSHVVACLNLPLLNKLLLFQV